MFLKCNLHYLQLRRQKNIKNIVGVLEVWYSDSGLTAESLKSNKKLKPKKKIPYFEFSYLIECTYLALNLKIFSRVAFLGERGCGQFNTHFSYFKKN